LNIATLLYTCFKHLIFNYQNSVFMKNRIEYQIDLKEIERFNQAMATAKEILLKIMANVTPDAVGPGQNMGSEGGWIYVQKGYAAAEKFPRLYDAEQLSLNTYKLNLDLARFMLDARKDIKSLDEWANIIGILTGKDLIDKTNHVRQRAQAKRKVNPEYAQISDELNVLFEKRAEKAAETRKINQEIKALKKQVL
jgi:hypothetical protein